MIQTVGEEFDAEGLLVPVMKKGRLVYNIPTVQQIQKATRKNIRKNITQLPEKYKALDCKTVYSVAISKRLKLVRDRTLMDKEKKKGR